MLETTISTASPTDPTGDQKPVAVSHTPGPWEYIASNENHGPYVCGPFGGDICDCYTMSNLSGLSVRNGGDSKPIPFQQDQADANARLIAAAPAMLDALRQWKVAETFKDFDELRNAKVSRNEAIAMALGQSQGTSSDAHGNAAVQAPAVEAKGA